MSDHKKDVTVFVTGVSMSGGVKNDSNGSAQSDKEKSEGEKARDSRSDG
jgi:hypothetical protein